MAHRGRSDTLAKTDTQARRSGRVRRFTALAVVIVSFAFLGRSTIAEFEIPLIDTTNAPAQPEFRGVWAFSRGFKYTSSATYNRYEAYAVGVDKGVTSCATGDVDDCNGIFYFYNGAGWARVANPFAGTPDVYSLNAVVGQEDHGDGNPSPMFVAGSKSRIGVIWAYYGAPGSSTTVNLGSLGNHPVGQFEPDVVDAPDDRDFYAIDAAQSYGRPLLAGGERGLIRVAYNKGGNPGNHWLVVDPGLVDDPDRRLQDPSYETITGIRFANLNTAYVVTSTFTANGGKLDRSCAGAQTSRLYKVDLSDPANSAWDPLTSSFNKCFFNLAISQRDDPSIHTPLQNVIWIAASDGVYKYDEAGGGLVPTNVTAPTYAVAAIPDRGGDGQNLLVNGGFESLLQSSFNPSPGLEVNPDGWLIEDQGIGTNNDLTSCGTNSKDITVTTDTGVTGNEYAVKIDTGVRYGTLADCNASPPLDPKYDFTTGVIQRVPLSTIEGQKFKVSGRYKVVFPSPGKLNATKAQGGVVVGCSGNSNNYEANFINCSLSNRSLVRTPDNPINDWEPFSLTMSREDLIFGGDIQRNKGRLTPRAMYLEVRCEATYGATVYCDDLKVEEVSDPPIPPRDAYTVIAAGADIAAYGIMVNTDALGVGSTFTAEALPNKVRSDALLTPDPILDDINAMTAAGLQHVYAVGQGKQGTATTGLALFNRTPSTLAGTIWAGVSSPTSPTASASLGSISVSCLNSRDAGATLCQRSPESYGLSLERHPVSPPGDNTLVGSLTGRAWFGKPTSAGGSGGSVDDLEQLNLGACLNKPGYLAADAYNLTGQCDILSRRCWADASHTAVTTKSCLSDFDCFGRCAKDEGFLCVKDDDCRIGPETFTNPDTLNSPTGNLTVFPGSQLSCLDGSPLACSSIGWLSFNKSDFDASHQTAPDGASVRVSYNTLFPDHNQEYNDINEGAHELSGWARFMTPANPNNPNSQDTGWVRLRGADTGASTSTKLFACRDCIGGPGQMNCSFCQDESNQSCAPSNTATEANCSYLCEDGSTPCVTNDQCGGVGSGQCKAPGFCTGDGTTSCTSDAACAPNNGHCAIGAICSPASSQCAKYGVNLDTETGKFYGYAWSQDFGWLSFQNVTQGGGRIIQTRLADIYAQGPIGAAGIPTSIDPNNCNGTYLITSSSGSITNFCSAYPTETGGTISGTNIRTIQPNSSFIPFPGAGNIYQNILGRFDLKGIETDVGGGKNKYGQTMRTLSPGVGNDISADWATQMQGAGPGKYFLGGKVYTVGDGSSTYALNGALQFVNSDNLGTSGSGAGILIVNGNLTINTPLSYETEAISDLRRLASLVVVVKGNLTIANTVQNLVGAYYVTGAVNTVSDPQLNNQYPLVVRGLMIASQFVFKRQYAGTIETPLPSELFIYDGRLQSNPLPGMTDFVNALPSTVNPGS